MNFQGSVMSFKIFFKIVFLVVILIILMALVAFSIWNTFHNATFDPSKEWDIPSYFYIVENSLLIGSVTLVSLFAILFLLEKTLKKGFYILVLLFLYIMISGKALALTSLMLFILANFGLGATIYSIFHRSKKINTQMFVTSYFVGLGINGSLIWIANHFKVNFQYTYYLFYIAQIVIFHKSIYDAYSKARVKVQTGCFSWGQNTLFVLAVFYIVYALVPQYQWDELVKHLYTPKYVLLNGIWKFDPHFVISLEPAIIPQSSYISVFLMGGEFSVRLLVHFTLFVTLFLMEESTRSLFGERAALFTILVCILTPFLIWEFSTVFIDSFVFFATGVTIAYLLFLVERIENRRYIVFYFILLSIAVFCKLQFVFIIIPSILIVIYLCLKRVIKYKEYRVIGNFFLGGAIFFLILAPVLIHNYVIADNPLFPWFNHIFKSEWMFTAKFTGVYTERLSWRTPYDLSFYNSKYMHGNNSSLGILYFVFLPFTPLLLLYKKNNKKILLLFVIFILSIPIWGYTAPDARYLLVIFPVSAVIIGLIMNQIMELYSSTKIRQVFIVPLFLVVFISNFICQMSYNFGTRPYPLFSAITNNSNNSSFYRDKKIKELFTYASIKYGNESKGLLISDPRMYFADFNVETDWWYHYKNQQEIISASKTAEDLFNNIFIKKGFDFIIMPDKTITGNVLAETEEFRKMLNREYYVMGLGLYSPKQ